MPDTFIRSLSPSPEPNSDTRVPRGAGFDSEFSEPSWLTITANSAGFADAIGHEAADAVIAGIGEVEIAGAVKEEAGGRVQQGCFGWPIVARVPRGAGAADRIDRAVGAHLPDAVIGGIGDEDIAAVIDCH